MFYNIMGSQFKYCSDKLSRARLDLNEMKFQNVLFLLTESNNQSNHLNWLINQLISNYWLLLLVLIILKVKVVVFFFSIIHFHVRIGTQTLVGLLDNKQTLYKENSPSE